MSRRPSGGGRMISGLLHPAAGPLVRVELRAPGGGPSAQGTAVLDTGASMSAIDQAVAATLGLPSPGAARWFAVSDTGAHPMSPLRRADVRMVGDRRLWELDLIEVPGLSDGLEGYDLVALLGWDFLGACKLVCDGPANVFTLELPGRRALRGSVHRRR